MAGGWKGCPWTTADIVLHRSTHPSSKIFFIDTHKRGSNEEAESSRYGMTRGDALRKSLHDMKKEWGLGVRPRFRGFNFSAPDVPQEYRKIGAQSKSAVDSIDEEPVAAQNPSSGSCMCVVLSGIG